MPVASTPRLSLRLPAADRVRAFLADQAGAGFSYRQTGATRGRPPRGYDYDDNHVQLGAGAAAFDRGCAALRAWRMFPAPWTRITPGDPPDLRPGLTVAMQARTLGLWWLNACRVVYVVDETQPLRRFGFAYGTLAAHVEQGEELFTIEHWPDDTVWYRVQAFSRPRFWAAKAAYPLVRSLQRKFVRDSLRQMRQLAATPA